VAHARSVEGAGVAWSDCQKSEKTVKSPT